MDGFRTSVHAFAELSSEPGPAEFAEIGPSGFPVRESPPTEPVADLGKQSIFFTRSTHRVTNYLTHRGYSADE